MNPWMNQMPDSSSGPTADLPALDAVGELLKHSPFRSVLRLPTVAGGKGLVVKEYREPRLRGRLRSALSAPGARVEERNLRVARARGLACPEPLQAAVAGGLLPARSWLALADLGPGRSLGRRLASLSEADALPLLARVGRLLSDALARGLDHRDLHLDNVYVGDDGELYLLDLHKARFHRASVRPTLGRLCGLYLGVPWPEQRAMRSALFGPLGLPPHPPELYAILRRHLAKRLVRCTRSSGSFVRHASGGRLWLRRRFFDGDPLTWNRVISAGEVRKSGRRGRVVACALGIAKLRSEAAALALWLAAEALALRGIPHPTALAWFPAEDTGYWVLSAAAGGQPLAALGGAPPSERYGVVGDLARSLAKLHATGWRCRDTRGDNFRCEGGRAVFLDLDGVQPFAPWRRRGVRAADLGRLLAWLRFEAPDGLRGMERELSRIFLASYLRTTRGLGGIVQPRRIEQDAAHRADQWYRQHSLPRRRP